MNRSVSEGVRRQVRDRAAHRCEYCLIAIADTFFGGEVDHIVSVKHGGAAVIENLAYTCQPCNRNKGSDLGSIHQPSGHLVRFFHPRTDRWENHFVLHGAVIRPLTAIGQVTTSILNFNSEERLQERQGLIDAGRYPPPAASIQRSE